MKNRAIAIITARGGSKKIPKKNIKLFCGKPIIIYSIEAALKSRVFDTVMVSTDSEEIAKISEEAGASIPFMRSELTSSDFATTEDVISEVLMEYKKLGFEFDNYCCIYPTAPFLSSAKLEDAMKQFEKSNASFLTPVVKYSYPPQRCLIVNDGMLQMKWPQYRKTRSQDLEFWYHDCGQFYIGCVKDLFLNGMSSGDTIPYILPELEVQDIDTEEDWILAEMKYKILNRMEMDTK
jgi:N-acylneuraminate cytidylyltransferase